MPRSNAPPPPTPSDRVTSGPSTARGAARAGLAQCAIALTLACALFATGCYDDVESRLAEIRALQSAGKFEESIQPLRVLLTAEPDNGEANFRLGVALVQTGRSSLALWPLMKASKTPEMGTQAGLLLATTLVAQESYKEAIRAATAILEGDPENISALYTRARAHVGDSHPAEAIKDADRILALRPDDGQAFNIKTAAYVDLNQLDEAEKVQIELKRVTELGTSIDKAARACGILARFYAEQGKTEEAQGEFQGCLEKYPSHSVVRSWASDFYTQSGQIETAVALWEKAVEDNPEALDLRFSLVDLLIEAERMDEAEKVMLEAADLFDSALAWQKLAGVQRLNQKPSEARESLQEALDKAKVEPEVLRYTLADIFIEEGDYASARKIAASLKEASYRHMLNGAIALAEGQPEEALKKFDAGFALWPNNARARYMAGLAALRAGNNERAIREFREAVRVGEAESDAALELARMYFSLGDYTSARQFANRWVASRPLTSVDGHVIAARCTAKLGEPDKALEVLNNLRTREKYAVVAVIEWAQILRESEGPKASSQYILESGLDLEDPANSLALRFLLDDMLAMGQADAARARADAALARDPESPAALELKGLVLARLGRTAEAKVLIEKAATLDPSYAPAQAALGQLAAQAGDYQGALARLDRAAEAAPENPDYAYQAAQLTMVLGQPDQNIARLRKILQQHPGHVGAANDLAWRLAEMEAELDFALALATRASLSEPSPDTLDTLGWVQYKQGSTEEAVATFRKAIAMRPESPSIQYRLGLALARSGASDEARSALETALAAGSPFPERDAAQAELARLQGS